MRLAQRLRRAASVLALLLGGSLAAAAQGAPTVYRFHLNRTGVPVPEYTLDIASDGSSAYWEGPLADPAQPPAATHFNVSPDTVQKVSSAAPAIHSGHCETKQKRIAQTGEKTVSILGGENPSTCTFNYSDDDRLNAATSLFQAVAETLQSGERLQQKLRFDRLGLDAEMDTLTGALKDGRAAEPTSIAPILRRIVADERVMERARRKAQRLLEADPAAPTP